MLDVRCSSERGVALVITLILLSVITFLAIAFLALSRRERGSVTTTTHMTEAKFASDTALERAKVEIIANILAYTNEFAFGLTVSTNYVNANGFNLGQPLGAIWPTNVNYVYPNGNNVTGPDAEKNIANLFYNPRPPVFIPNPTNRNLRDFRYYLDLNRNGRYDTNGLRPVLDNLGKPILDASNNIVSSFFVGDPEWIGGLDRPDFPHSPSNRFTHRYAYLVVPTGKTLDANFIHNQAYTKSLTGGDGFMRNEGVGTWEINLAAFLADLNTNQWNPNGISYKYQRPAFQNSGLAFDDARSFLSHRYAGNYNNLRSVNTLFGGVNASFIADNLIDEYSDGDLFLTANSPAETPFDPTGLPWVGDDNPNHYFTTQDLFDPTKTSAVFTNHLLSAGNGISSYDRNTFSRLVEQLGTDSSSENRMNLNYRNIRNGVVVPGMETNFASWTPLEFFTNAAERLLRGAGFAFGVTNIPIYNTTNLSLSYTPAIHRLLQLAANLYDATATTNASNTYPYFPSVFRPIFQSVNGGNEVYITGYAEETTTNFLYKNPLDVNNPTDRANLKSDDNMYGIPVVIGAKKGFPNFNELSMLNRIQVTRLLQFRKPSVGATVNETNQMYTVGISNIFGIEAWNSYSMSFPRDLQMLVTTETTAVITNESGLILLSNRYPAGSIVYIPANSWAGFPRSPNNRSPFDKPSYRIPLSTNHIVLTNATFVHNPPHFQVINSANYERTKTFPLPQLWLNVNTRFRYIVVDSGRVIDCVTLNNTQRPIEILSELAKDATCPGTTPTADLSEGAQWCTNRINNKPASALGVPTYGIVNQIRASLYDIQLSTALWNSYSQNTASGKDREKAIDAFRVFFDLSQYFLAEVGKVTNTNLVQQAPFNPSRIIYDYVSWKVNDPLVHYTASDLQETNTIKFQPTNPLLDNLGRLNPTYKPWGGYPLRPDPKTDYVISLKDPLVSSSDDWDFPTNKFPNVGWMGRVHRGTPWQTVYMKSENADTNTWISWSGDRLVQSKWYGSTDDILDATRTHPINDRTIFDLFTAAPNDNAGRGQLSVNQANLAAWSAVLSGIVVLTNDSSSGSVQLLPRVINPAGIYDPFDKDTSSGGKNPQLAKIWTGINLARAATNMNGPVFPNMQFHHVGDILAAPELTVNSPFLNTKNLASLTAEGLNDAAIERIPQQILGLLRAGEQRFVIYAYGQSLRPADNSVLTRGPFRGMCTNYQIMAEVAARAVVRMDIQRDSNGQITGANTVVESYNLLPPD